MALQQPRLLIPRVAGRDLRVLVDHPYVHVRASDVEAIAGVPPWSTGETLLGPVEQLVVFDGVEYYPVSVAVTRARDEGMDRAGAAAFLDWVDEGLPALLDPEMLDRAARRASFASSFTVARAAELLSRDPRIEIGRDRLFDHLERIGWIHRPLPDEAWRLTAVALEHDWLTTRPMTIGHGRHARHYEQVHVTPAGMTELARTFFVAFRPTAPVAAAPVLPLPEWSRS